MEANVTTPKILTNVIRFSSISVILLLNWLGWKGVREKNQLWNDRKNDHPRLTDFPDFIWNFLIPGIIEDFLYSFGNTRNPILSTYSDVLVEEMLKYYFVENYCLTK